MPLDGGGATVPVGSLASTPACTSWSSVDWITTFRGSDSDAKERFIYHTAGLDGTGSASYIDDVVLIDADVNSGWTSAADSTKEVRRYYLQNWRHDVVAILSDGGKLIQNIAYLAYGKAYGLPAGDRDGSGTWTSADATAISGYGGSYRVDYDTDLDGDIDAADVTWANAITGGYYDLGLDRLSSSSVFNRRGYAGYEHAWELDGTKYHVRNRVLDSELGRWNRRDPLGYVDGMGMYEYVAAGPFGNTDSSGERSMHCTDCNGNSEEGDPDPWPHPPARPRWRYDAAECGADMGVNYTTLCATYCQWRKPNWAGRFCSKTYPNGTCCVCRNNMIEQLPHPSHPNSQVLANCLAYHEWESLRRQGCPAKGRRQHACEELEGHRLELECLRSHRNDCDNAQDPQHCRENVDFRIRYIEENILPALERECSGNQASP